MHVGLVHNWPGSKNSELDLIQRIAMLLQRWGHEATMLDPVGKRLDLVSGEHLDDHEMDPLCLDFVLYLHYLNPKLIDSFSYVVNWNPLKYLIFDPSSGEPLSAHHVDFIRDAMISHDHMLSASSNLVDEFQYALFGDTHWAPKMDELKFHTTCQIFNDLEPVDLDDFRVFYIGANWEKVAKVKNPEIPVRHEGLLESLDATGKFVFYGIQKQSGVDLWEGFSHYYGELPFDAGESIVRTCHKHGVALVLSSDAHRQSGVVSTRLFQACAARCVVIADNNSFIEEQFGDAVLIFDYVEDVDSTVANIMEKVEWIRAHPEEARKKAEVAHKIFKEHFSLDSELGRMLEHHAISKDRKDMAFANAKEYEVVTYFICENNNIPHVKQFLQQIQAQKWVNVTAVLAVAPDKFDDVNCIVSSYSDVKCEVFSELSPDEFAHGAIFHNIFSKLANCAFFAVWNPRVSWHSDHLANLVYESLSAGSLVVQSAVYVANEWFKQPAADSYYTMHSIAAVKRVEFTEMMLLNKSRIEFSSFLFSSKILFQSWVSMSLLSYLDSLYPFLFMVAGYNQQEKLPAFVQKYTCCHQMLPNVIDMDKKYPEAGDFFLTYEERQSIFSIDQQIAFIRGAMSTDDTYRLALSHASSVYMKGGNSNAGITIVQSAVSQQFSLNNYMHGILCHRPFLLKSWEMLFSGMVRLLKL